MRFFKTLTLTIFCAWVPELALGQEGGGGALMPHKNIIQNRGGALMPPKGINNNGKSGLSNTAKNLFSKAEEIAREAEQVAEQVAPPGPTCSKPIFELELNNKPGVTVQVLNPSVEGSDPCARFQATTKQKCNQHFYYITDGRGKQSAYMCRKPKASGLNCQASLQKHSIFDFFSGKKKCPRSSPGARRLLACKKPASSGGLSGQGLIRNYYGEHSFQKDLDSFHACRSLVSVEDCKMYFYPVYENERHLTNPNEPEPTQPVAYHQCKKMPRKKDRIAGRNCAPSNNQCLPGTIAEEIRVKGEFTWHQSRT